MVETLQSILMVVLCLSAALVLSHLNKNPATLPIRILLTFFVLIGIYHFTNYGQFFTVKKDTPEFVELKGTQTKPTYFHWHEIYHYYLGAKYYKENGHNGLYNSVLLADRESANPMITIGGMRDSLDGILPMSADEGLRRAREIHRPKFSDERWTEFKQDLEYLKSIALPDWLNLGMFDAGYNPPPTWSVIGYPLANILPLSHNWFDYGPAWDQSEFLPLLDVLLMTIAFYFVYRSFGYVGLCIFLIAFFTNILANSHWVAGSFLRHMWLFGLVIGICFLREKKYFYAGLFLGFSTLMRFFPAAFFLGAMIAIFLRYKQGKASLDDLKSLVLGGVAVTAVLVPASFIMFGIDLWKEFFENIISHNKIYFVYHIGYKKIAVFDAWVPNQNFWWMEGLERFAHWNARLVESWNETFPYHFAFMMVMLGVITWVMRKLPVEESSVLFGFAVIFFFAIPANYYYSYIALVPLVTVFSSQRDERKDALIAFAFFIALALMYTYPRFIRDDLVFTYYNCLTLLMFLIFWTMTRAINLAEIQRFSQPELYIPEPKKNLKKARKTR